VVHLYTLRHNAIQKLSRFQERSNPHAIAKTWMKGRGVQESHRPAKNLQQDSHSLTAGRQKPENLFPLLEKTAHQHPHTYERTVKIGNIWLRVVLRFAVISASAPGLPRRSLSGQASGRKIWRWYSVTPI